MRSLFSNSIGGGAEGENCLLCEKFQTRRNLETFFCQKLIAAALFIFLNGVILFIFFIGVALFIFLAKIIYVLFGPNEGRQL